jgi:hypothetical protein
MSMAAKECLMILLRADGEGFDLDFASKRGHVFR